MLEQTKSDLQEISLPSAEQEPMLSFTEKNTFQRELIQHMLGTSPTEEHVMAWVEQHAARISGILAGQNETSSSLRHLLRTDKQAGLQEAARLLLGESLH